MKKGFVKKIFASALLGIMAISFVGCKASDNSQENNKDLLQTIKENKKIVVGMSADYAPYEFHYIDESGKDVIGGFDVDIANEIADAIGVELVIQEMDFDALVSALPAGKIDLVISGMNPTEERAKVVDFSEIYYNSQHGILVRAEDVNKYEAFSDLDGLKVGAQLGSTQENIARSEIKNAELQLLNNVNNLILELKAGKIDAVILEKPVAEMATKSNKELALGIPIYEDKTGGNAVGVAKNNPELLEKVNEVIKDLNDSGKIDEYILKANELAGSVNIVEESVEKANFDFSFVKEYMPYYLKGATYTLMISLITVFFGAVFGSLLFFMKTSNFSICNINPLKILAVIYIEIVRGTPMLLQILIMYAGSKMFFGIDLSPFISAIIAIALNSAAYVSEIVRAGIEAVDKGQMEAARSLGMKKSMAMILIVIPQAVKNILPAIGNEFVAIIKESSMASIIGVNELMFAGKVVVGSTYLGLEPYIVAAGFYFIMTFTLGRVIYLIERRMRKSDSR